jgi:mersacidin/lichenicidin family type 2 lantibiotic
MSPKDVIRAWKNEEYAASLSPAEASALPENPAGNIELRSHRNTRGITLFHLCNSIVIECSASNCA